MIRLALYAGPPSGFLNLLGHYLIRLWTWSRWSHVELVIDGTAWSASARDRGVRGKRIDLTSGKWDVISVPLTDDEIDRAHQWFLRNEGQPYDYRNLLRFVFPFVGHNGRHWVCFEAVAAALGMAAPHKITANDLWAWAETRLGNN